VKKSQEISKGSPIKQASDLLKEKSLKIRSLKIRKKNWHYEKKDAN
jgi:hypothetical protein